MVKKEKPRAAHAVAETVKMCGSGEKFHVSTSDAVKTGTWAVGPVLPIMTQSGILPSSLALKHLLALFLNFPFNTPLLFKSLEESKILLYLVDAK